MISCILSIPPSANQIWRTVDRGSRHWQYKTDEARRWQEEAAWELRLSAKGQKIPFEKAGIEAVVYFPDKRRRDIDNILKLIGDAIQGAGVVKNDSDIYQWVIKRDLDIKKSRVELKINKL